MAKKTLKLILIFTAAVCLLFLIICRRRPVSGTLQNTANSSIVNKNFLVITVHGWIDSGKNRWPEDMAGEIAKKADSQLWASCFFDWSEGAAEINPADAVHFAKEKAGPALASQVLRKFPALAHIHLIGHSSGCWVVNEAAKIIAENTSADLHLTFLDAYAPSVADTDLLGDIPVKDGQQLFVEHYFTRDYTGTWTELKLKHAHNIDITQFDAAVKDHRFPWRWYYATISGKYPSSIFSDGTQYSCVIDGIEYGFIRSKEAGSEQKWQDSLLLKTGNDPLVCE